MTGPKKPIELPVLPSGPTGEAAWKAEDEAVPHPEASAAPELERAFLHSFAGEARAPRQCCEEMEVQLGFSRTQPVILFDGKGYWLPAPTGNPGVIPTVGARVRFCPWCGRDLERARSGPKSTPRGPSRPPKKKFRR